MIKNKERVGDDGNPIFPQQGRWRKMNRTQLCCWSEYFLRSGNLFRGENQPLVLKMECHRHHSGNRTLIFHFPLRLVSRCFLVAPRCQSVWAWSVRSAKFLFDRGTTGEFQLFAIVVSCLTERWRTAATNVYAQFLVFCMLCGAISTGGNDWITDMADRILARSGTGYQKFGFVK